MTTNASEQFARLFTRHEREIRRYVYSLTGNRNDTDDVMQETSVALWDKFAEYDLDKPFLGWALRFAYYQTKRHQRNQARRLRFKDELLDLLADEYLQDQPYLEAQRHAVRSCLTKLSPKERLLAQLRFGMRLTIPQIGERLGAANASKQTYRLLERLRLRLLVCTQDALAQEGW